MPFHPSRTAFCVHAHFYQPPREDPFRGEIPLESSAAPYPNWNERIYAECYRPNAQLRNFEQISFDVGPTLFAWLEKHHPVTYQQILEQERRNLARYGVGNAMAQPYHHIILPLATTHDKIVQVYWGLVDFEHRFGHKAQGMWLPETAVDYETLEVLARAGLTFTILAPWQADVDALDPTEPYCVPLPSGAQMVVFFYQAELSGRLSFDPLATVNADHFLQEMLRAFNPEKERRGDPQLVLLASDGELYGHHQPHRDLFLSHLVNGASAALDLAMTYPALWLQEHPVSRTIGLRENTSWSCHHGVGRWTGECACTPHPQWKQGLRRALRDLAVQIDDLYVAETRSLVRDPWRLLARYIHVLLGEMSLAALLTEESQKPLTEAQIHRLDLLLQAEYERQRMFTSCGWFFEEFDRIEPRNNLAFAARAVWLVHQATQTDLEPLVLRGLEGVSDERTKLNAVQVFADALGRAPAAAYPLSRPSVR